MSEAKQCDRCGNYYPTFVKGLRFEDEWWRYKLTKDCHPYEEIKVDLCPDCRRSLYNWLKREVSNEI